MFPYSRQFVSKKDIDAVKKVLKSDFLTQGKKVIELEKKVSKVVNSKFSIAVNSATSALHIACLSLGIKKNDYLWTSSNTFVASANCGRYCGAKVKFLDIDPDTYNICPYNLEKELKRAKIKKKLPKIVVVVHMAGLPADMFKIKKLSDKYNFKIIEDASHALGSKIGDEKTGSCKFSDITIFSFHPVKIITSGEGGLATTNNFKLFKKMKLFREHGIERSNFKNKKSAKFKWYYEQHVLGYNYRMSDIHASLAISQLSRLKKIIITRNTIAKNYQKILSKFPLKLPQIPKDNLCSFHLYIIQIKKDYKKSSREKLFNYLRKNKIYTNLHYMPVHLHPYYYRNSNTKIRNAEEYSKYALSIPIYEKLRFKDQLVIKKIIQKGLRFENK